MSILDAASLLDVIEHFPKPEALALLDTLERRAGVVVLFTPIGFYRQNAGAWKEHVRFRYGQSWWYSALRNRRRQGG